MHLCHTNAPTFALDASKKFTIPKNALNEAGSNDKLNDENKKILQSWLAARYKRHAFPDSLVSRLKPVDNLLKKQGKKNAHEITAYWVNYEPKNKELLPNEPYEISLKIIYCADAPDAENKAQKIAESLKTTDFTSKMMQNTEHGAIDLRLCQAWSDMEFTLHDMHSGGYVEYALDYISHQAES